MERIILSASSARAGPDANVAGSASRILTLAPELQDAADFIRALAASGLVLGLKRSSGAIRGGARADLVVLKRQLQVRQTLVGGSRAYRRES